MKVLDLQCRLGHSFEGWFGSQTDYDAQRARGLVTCPVCNDSEITKMPSAPRLNLGHAAAVASASGQDAAGAAAAPAEGPADGPADGPAGPGAAPAGWVPSSPSTGVSDARQQMQAAMLSMVRHVLAHTEDVGPHFVEEARKIHYGESEARHIRGQATRAETEALLDEGIEVLALPVPENLKGPLQ